jgi:hypothetical protein
MNCKQIAAPRTLAALILSVAVGSGVYADNGRNKSAIDFVKNPSGIGPYVTMAESEFRKFCGYLQALDRPLRLVDPNNDENNREQIEEWRAENNPMSDDCASDYELGMTVGYADRLAGMRPRRDSWQWVPKELLMRRTYDERAISQATPFDGAQGALLSFTRDFENISDTWEAHGAIMYPVKVIDEGYVTPVAGIASLYAMPSITFDRISNNTDETKEVDSLVARLGVELGVKKIGPPVQFFRAGLAYATDFDLESGVAAVEFDWEPVWSILGIGTSQPVPLLPLTYRLRTILHAKYGRVTATGNKDLEKHDDFFRYGPKIQLELFPALPELDRLSVLIKYEYLEGSSGKPGHSDLFEVGMSYQLDDEGHLGLDLTYRNGDIPLTKESVDSLSFGLSVKF